MSSHRASAKARSPKCRHFCYPFDTHNYCPTCRESGKGDDPCVTNQFPCNIFDSFTEVQQIKIKHRCRYIRKQKSLDPNTSKDDLDLLGNDGDVFSGSQADLEGAPENLVSSPPRLQPLCFESLSLKMPQTVSPTPGTALQNKIESRLEKSLGSTFNIQLKQEMALTLFQLGLLFQGHPTTRMFNLWTLNIMDLHFLPSLLKMSSPNMLPSNRILNLTTRNIIPSRTSIK